MTTSTANSPSTRTVLIWIALAAVLLIGGPLALYVRALPDPYEVPEGTDITELVAGTWAWEDDTCDEYQRITFSADRSEMSIEHPRAFEGVDGEEDSTTSYRVLGVFPDRVRGQIPGESRLTASGEPAVWDLVLLDEHTFAWHRTDWPPFSLTKSMVRCEDA